MRVPTMAGLIDRRILVNFRVEPDVLQTVLPQPFRVQRFRGVGIAGICLIRLKKVRPKWLPGIIGFSSENAAHRVAVEWDGPDGIQTGVYVPRRDTDSRLNALVGGRLFPGTHYLADFDVSENEPEYSVRMKSRDGHAGLFVHGTETADFPAKSIFETLMEASAFFEAGSLGYSPNGTTDFDGLELRTHNWSVTALDINKVESQFFADTTRFPNDSVQFDHALLMRDIDHEWHSRDSICCEARRE